MARAFDLYVFVIYCLMIMGEVSSRRTSAGDDEALKSQDIFDGIHRSNEATTTECRRALDVVFLVDGSSDVSDSDWNSSVDLVSRVSSQLNLSVFGTHVGVALMIPSMTWAVHPLSDQPPTLNDTALKLMRRHMQRHGRDLAAAVISVRSHMFNNRDGDRPEVPDVLVTITHRVSDNVRASFVAAEQLKSDGIRIITVGIVSGGVDELRAELQAIATYPRESDRLVSHYYPTVLPRLVTQAICRREFDAVESSLRLADETAASGRLEMFVGGEWTTVCANSWTRLNTEVACRELGFPDAVSWNTVDEHVYWPRRRTGLGNVTCSGNESRLVDCRHDPFFVVEPNCDHRRDVFLRCLCVDCADYRPRDNVRLVDGGSVYGRLEIFSPERGWGGVCRRCWSSANTRVVCRQLGFLDGARSYNDDDTARFTALSLGGRVNCVGNESSLFDCDYHAASANSNCSQAVNVLCRCGACLEPNLLRSPRESQTTMGSAVEFEWKLKNGADDDVEFWFLTRKNRRLVLRRSGARLTTENTELRNRVQLIGDNETTVGFRLTNVTGTDMGTYALHVPRRKLFDSQAILFVTDFAVVPDAVVRRRLGDGLALRWDLTAVRQLLNVTHQVLLTTPASGRLRLDYYNAHWTRDNEPRHSVAQSTDHLHPTVVIDEVTAKDAGDYVVEVTLTSSVHRWLNASWQFTTTLVVKGAWQAGSQSVGVVTLLATFLSMTLAFLGVLLVLAVCRRCRHTRTDDNLSPPPPLSSTPKQRSAHDDNSYIETDIYDDSGPPMPSRLYSVSAKSRRSRFADTSLNTPQFNEEEENYLAL